MGRMPTNPESRIKLKGDCAEVSFNESVYDKAFIESAAAEFSRYRKVTIDNSTVLIRARQKEKPRFLALEFYNYVLGLMKNS